MKNLNVMLAVSSSFRKHNYIIHNYIIHNYIIHNYIVHNYVKMKMWSKRLSKGASGALWP